MLGFPAQSMQTRNPGQRGRPSHIVPVTLGLVVIKPWQVLRCVPTLRRILPSLVPHCLIYPPQQPHREVWGPHISTLEMTKPRLGRLGLSPICFLLLSPPNAVPRSQGYDSLAGGGGQIIPELPSPPPGFFSRGALLSYVSRLQGEKFQNPFFSSKYQCLSDNQGPASSILFS